MNIKTFLMQTVGLLSLAIGAVGVVVPLLPTTPFVLLSASCLSTSPKLRATVMKINFFQAHIQNYENRTGLTRKNIVMSLSFLWGTLSISGFLMGEVWIALLLLCIGVAVSTHILWIASPKKPNGKSMKQIAGCIEVAFDIAYLAIASAIGILILSRDDLNQVGLLSGIMALILVGGDAFHLVPRIQSILSQDKEAHRQWLGRGKQITSISMTVFYLLLWQIALLLYPQPVSSFWSNALYLLAAMRILLCLLPQNGWCEINPPSTWGILRNIPFFLMGLLVSGIYFLNRDVIFEARLMWLAILLSFSFYLPVVLWSHKNPKVGMLMLPKTCVYIWMLFICLSL